MVLVLVRVIAGGHLAWLQPFRESGGCASAVTPFRHPEATLRRKLGVWFALWTATEYHGHRSWPICLWRGQIMQGSKKDVVGSDWVIQPGILPGSKNWVPASVPSVLWHCWLGGRKGIRPVKNWAVGCWRGYCLERDADLHMAQLMPLPLTVSCFSKIQFGLPFWYRLTWVVPEKGPLNGCVCVCVWRLAILTGTVNR